MFFPALSLMVSTASHCQHPWGSAGRPGLLLFCGVWHLHRATSWKSDVLEHNMQLLWGQGMTLLLPQQLTAQPWLEVGHRNGSKTGLGFSSASELRSGNRRKQKRSLKNSIYFQLAAGKEHRERDEEQLRGKAEKSRSKVLRRVVQ